MRLAQFIISNVEPILVEWEIFARGIWPGVAVNAATLRDHARDILLATAADMGLAQTDLQQSDKSKGDGDACAVSGRVDSASEDHAVGRVRSGFDMMELVAEYRALRASVIRLWRESGPDANDLDLADLTRFNESIDQSLTEAIRSYTATVDRSRHMFLAILGHDLRNPLNAISMSASLLSETASDSDAGEIAQGILNGAKAMGGMIADLLDFTSAGIGSSMPLTPVPTDLRRLGQEVFDETRAAHPASVLRYQPEGDLTGQWDPARLRQLLSNLLGNAVHHGAGAPVELTIRRAGDDVRIAVTNGGTPISAGALPTIFDPLVRDMTPAGQARRRPGSIGLGLYIAREIVTAHGGEIDVTSSAAAGTVFTVRLPLFRKQ